jgi:hypothetical protein
MQKTFLACFFVANHPHPAIESVAAGGDLFFRRSTTSMGCRIGTCVVNAVRLVSKWAVKAVAFSQRARKKPRTHRERLDGWSVVVKHSWFAAVR